MSKPRRMDDVERTCTMLDLVRRQYPAGGAMSLSHVVIEEVAPSTGWAARRWADVLALSVWPSKGLALDGYEVKASRGDLKRELADPAKHEALARYCDAWWLVVWDEAVITDVPPIPESWGIMITMDGEFGRELEVKRRPAKRTPEPWPREFICSLVRNAFEQSPGAAYVARACAEANRVGRSDAEYLARSARDEAARAIGVALYGAEHWKWPKEARSTEHLLKMAAERLTQLPLAAEEVSHG
jgi:hypothetical protein